MQAHPALLAYATMKCCILILTRSEFPICLLPVALGDSSAACLLAAAIALSGPSADAFEQRADKLRIVEILLGILGNLACHPSCVEQLSSTAAIIKAGAAMLLFDAFCISFALL